MNNIQLVKRQEDVNRNFDGSHETETVNRVNYKVMRDGTEIGTADVWAGNLTINIYVGAGNIAENTAMVEKMFSALNEEE